MAVRPSDWFLVGLPVDPTPGDAFGIRALAGKYGEIAQIAGEASSGVRHARSSGAASAWVGDAGDIFRDRSERMPGELAKANDSYELVAEALRTWAAAVDDTQAQADRGLQQAREAHHDLSAAQAALHSAEWSWTTAHAQQLTYQTLKKAYSIVPPPPNVKMPTDYQLRSVDRSAQQAQASMASAKHAIADADARLAAARALVLEAKERRDHAERAVVHQIAQAGDHAVKPSSIWEAIQSSAAWQAFVTIATVVLTIVSIVAIFVGGPLVWALIIAASVVLIADALMQASEGKDVTWTLVFLLVGLIPGGRAISSAAKIADAFRAGDGVLGGLKGVGLELGNATKTALIGTIRSLQKSVVGLVPGVVSVLHSLPNAARDAAANSHGFSFLGHLISNVKSDFTVATNAAWSHRIATVGAHDPAGAAALSQGSGAFHGLDHWVASPSSEPRIYEIGAGGDPSGFMLRDGTSDGLGNVASEVWQHAQVPTGGPAEVFRDGMWSIRVDPGVPVAESVVTANPLLGPGGSIQGFVPDVMTRLQPGGGVTLIDRVTGTPILPRYTEVTNFAGEHFGWTIKDASLDIPAAPKPLVGPIASPDFVSGHAVAQFWKHDEQGVLTRIGLRLGTAGLWGEQAVVGVTD